MNYEEDNEIAKDIVYLNDVYTKFSYDSEIMEKAFNTVFFKYSGKIQGFESGMDVISVFDKKTKMAESLRKNIQLVIKRLEIYQNSGFREECLYEHYLKEGVQGETLNISFQEARKILYEKEGMSASEKKEIEEKLDEVEQIYESVDAKKNKWNRMRPILMWLSGKDVDTGLTFLALIQKIN
ncbi:MAG: hypothetical protein HFE62_00700 [Firmicutes bacterium]|nr:hypothetical protein [Bacillota bacterium]